LGLPPSAWQQWRQTFESALGRDSNKTGKKLGIDVMGPSVLA
jgi:hypothetical protein